MHFNQFDADSRMEGAQLHRPAYVVLPVQTKRNPRLRPVLGIRTLSGEVVIPREAILWTRSIALSRPFNDAFKMLSTLGRLHQYTSISFKLIELSETNLLLVIWNYLAFRVGDRSPDDPDLLYLPNWRPISEAAALQEFRTIVSFVRFCNRTLGTLPMLSPDLSLSDKFLKDFNYDAAYDRDFFVHLKPQRARWRELVGAPDLIAPRLSPSVAVSPQRASAMGSTMPSDEVEAIISHERNPVFQALWVLLAFGGIRISEALNIWVIDIMPGGMLRYFTRAVSTSEPLVILAHPAESRFTGDVRGGANTREHVLKDVYGLSPRPLYPQKHTMRAGWKGMMFNEPQLKLSWVYWSNPAQARRFASLASSILEMHDCYQTSHQHPYFFINAFNAVRLGAPVTYGNAQKAFERASRRVGLEPHALGRHLHGFRDFYLATLKQLGISREYRQVMLHHCSPMSQDDYDKISVETHVSLSNAHQRMSLHEHSGQDPR